MLRRAGHSVSCVDASLDQVAPGHFSRANLIAFYLPMHTATRLAVPLIRQARVLNQAAHICCYGLYATPNAEYLHSLGVQAVVSGEFEQALVDLACRLEAGTDGSTDALVRLDRIRFMPPDRQGLPELARYAAFVDGGDKRVAGYTEASRGCKHLCRHCPVVPVYEGKFRIVPADVVMDDIRRQVAAGAQHITFGDPDFFNGPKHASKIVESFHEEFPHLSYDVTIKVEHLIRQRGLVNLLSRTGCRLVTTAVESVDDAVLEKLAKGHTRADFIECVEICRTAGLPLSPTFIPFTPWTTRQGLLDLLELLLELDLVESVSPVQLALRLLIPAGSRLLDLDDVRRVVLGFEPSALVHRWHHPDPVIDQLAGELLALAASWQKTGASRGQIFAKIWERIAGTPFDFALPARATIPYLTEPWYC
jgi:radical SAM superfamily enzyme YgiQ (UPF0313 family)